MDLSHVTEDPSQKEKDREIKDFADILGINLSTEPAAEEVEKPVELRRSTRIKELEQKQKPKVEHKNEQVKRTRRK